MKTVSNAVGEFLKRPLVSTLATIDEDGSPRTRAIWHDWSEQGLLLFTSTKSPKWKNIEIDIECLYVLMIQNHLTNR